jgi:hypothetical protein
LNERQAAALKALMLPSWARSRLFGEPFVLELAAVLLPLPTRRSTHVRYKTDLDLFNDPD